MDDDDDDALVNSDYLNINSLNCDPSDVEIIDNRHVSTSTVRRSISHPPPHINIAPSPIHRAVSEGSGNKGAHTDASGGSGEKTALPQNERLKLVSKFVKWWRIRTESNTKIKNEQNEEYKMRHKLKYHFMSPMQKYKHGRKPWKLVIQIIKIIIVTAQVGLFGAERFSSVLFINHTHESLRYLFIQGYTEPKPFNYYSRQELANAIIFAKETYNELVNKSIGIFWYDKPSEPISLCEKRYVTYGNDTAVIDYSSASDLNCSVGIPYDVEGLLEQFHKKRYFDSLKAMFLKFQLKTMFINGLRMLHRPECYHLDNELYIDNDHHDGKLQVTINMEHYLLQRCPKEFKEAKDAEIVRGFYVAFDGLVVLLCTISLFLCIRSVRKAIRLGSVARKYFLEYKREELSNWDLFELINKWFIVIVLSDLLSIIGSIYKIRVDYRDIYYYNICSLFLGIGVLLVWVGILRFFTYIPNYNILLIALRVAAPNLMRFMFCALFIFFGFTFCGWIVLGPYHEKFNTFSKTCDCLYSLLNGDDMYVTFNIMSDASTPVWIFSKIYLYVFISLFIYVVLSTFISIVSDSYERMKLSGKMPPTKIESFMDGKSERCGINCTICSRDDELSESSITATAIFSSLQKYEDLTSSTLSVMSASLD